ncbi:Coiled-coil domain-containing protein 39 [Tritrichomonas foetus]|uniref:Coiled-coil domain-containing protein 39 n=1 Tax=Tritrichomonas foetus TaxID=1144522 RepID=A0A1J4JN44_9EUKA|nr:Coiled-coil domain-containing protein 39 [Tritrichomonas foetus]|eukprot:OHS98925.1 Coiled-coil domain-containing protein 39 [Tritrichomonas foetus]
MTSAYKLYDVLPDFANNENREKHASIQEKISLLETLESDCKDINDRHIVLQEHLKNVHQEVSSVEQLITEKEKQVEEEKHLESIVERERGKIRVDYEKTQDETDDVQSKWSVIQGKIQIAQNRIEKFKEDLQINQKEVEEWEAAAKQKEEDFLLVQKYQKDDESRIKNMIREMEQSAILIENKKNELQQEILNTKSLQIELDTTADYFRKIHEERTKLLAQWEDALKRVQALNEQIESATEAYDSRRGIADIHKGKVAEKKKNYDLTISQNKQIERHITICDHQVSAKNQQVEKEENQILDFQEVVATERQKLDKFESDQRAYNEQIADYQNKIAQKMERKEELLIRLQETQDAFNLQRDYTKEISEQTNLMNEMMKNTENKLKQMDNTIEDKKKEIFNLTQEVFELRKQEKLLLAEIQGSQSRDKNLRIRIKDIDGEIQKQLELLYNSNFQIAQMERKISMMQGHTTQDEKAIFEQQISELEKIYASKNELERVLNLQLHRLDLDMRSAKRQKENLEKTQIDLSIKLNEIQIDQESLDKSVNNVHRQKEDKLVQLNILRLQIEKLAVQVEEKSDEVISLENRREQLKLSMQQRANELQEHLSGLKVQLKLEQEAKHVAIVELAERKKREATMANKFQILMGVYNATEEGTIEDIQANFVMKSAREREEITKRGDELEGQVKDAIKELRMLENQMEKLNVQTVDFKKGFQTEDPEQMEKLRCLEEQLKAVQQRVNTKKAEARSIQEEKYVMDRTYMQKQDIIHHMTTDINKMQPNLERLQQENHELKEKLTRATAALKKA